MEIGQHKKDCEAETDSRMATFPGFNSEHSRQQQSSNALPRRWKGVEWIETKVKQSTWSWTIPKQSAAHLLGSRNRQQ